MLHALNYQSQLGGIQNIHLSNDSTLTLLLPGDELQCAVSRSELLQSNRRRRDRGTMSLQAFRLISSKSVESFLSKLDISDIEQWKQYLVLQLRLSCRKFYVVLIMCLKNT